jgi:hypothetical protein
MKTSRSRDQNPQSQDAIPVHLNLIQLAEIAQDFNLKGVAQLKPVLSLLSNPFHREVLHAEVLNGLVGL